MRYRSAISFVILLQLLAATAIAAKSPGEFIDDATVTARVKLALAEQSPGDALDINVETSNGVVQLSGWVKSDNTKAMAGRVAKGTEGVEAVSNRLLISTGSRSAGRVLDDSLLAAKVKLALTESDKTNSMKINVEVRNATVELSGFVDTYEERDAAVDLVEDIDGVDRVIDSIDITPGRK